MTSSGTSKKSVDILLPYWGDVGLLKESVDSVLTQTSSDWHLTIIDDHYESEEAKEYFRTLTHPQITYIRHPQNIGITRNFNFAVETATAPYCTIMGCDDRLLPNYVEHALQTIGDCDFYQPQVQVIDAKGEQHLPMTDKIKKLLTPKRPGVYKGEKLASSLCHGNWLYFPSILWKTSTLKKYPFNTKYKIVEDFDVEIRMIIDGATLYVDKGSPTFQYRRFSESLSSKEKKRGGVRFNEEEAIYADFAKKFSKIGWKKARRAAKLHITSRVNSFVPR